MNDGSGGGGNECLVGLVGGVEAEERSGGGGKGAWLRKSGAWGVGGNDG